MMKMHLNAILKIIIYNN